MLVLDFIFCSIGVNKTGTFSLENAVEKLTSDPAAKYRIKERGTDQRGVLC